MKTHLLFVLTDDAPSMVLLVLHLFVSRNPEKPVTKGMRAGFSQGVFGRASRTSSSKVLSLLKFFHFAKL